jgi:hypothetical protein
MALSSSRVRVEQASGGVAKAAGAKSNSAAKRKSVPDTVFS